MSQVVGSVFIAGFISLFQFYTSVSIYVYVHSDLELWRDYCTDRYIRFVVARLQGDYPTCIPIRDRCRSTGERMTR